MVLHATLLTLGNGQTPLYSLNFPNVVKTAVTFDERRH